MGEHAGRSARPGVADGRIVPLRSPLSRVHGGVLEPIVSPLESPIDATPAAAGASRDARSRRSDRNRAFEEFQARRNFGALDGLRALSILGVIWHHAGEAAFSWAFFDRGAEGVSFFFVISGFLITTLLLRERDHFGTISLRKFFARRTLRIFPLYFAVLAGFCAIGLYRGIDSDFGSRFFPHLPKYLTYTSNWSDARSAPFGYSWSLACEEQFYLLWPPVLVLLGTRGATCFLIALLAANRAAHFGWLDAVLPQEHFVNRLLLTVQPAILFGVLLAVALHARRGYAALAPLLRKRAAAAVAFAIVLGMLSLKVDLHATLLVDAAMAIAVGACVVPATNALTPLLTAWPMRRIGAVSYGMYMFHEPLRTVLRRFSIPHPVILFVILTLLAWAVAELSFRTFEKPFLRLKSRFERNRGRESSSDHRSSSVLVTRV